MVLYNLQNIAQIPNAEEMIIMLLSTTGPCIVQEGDFWHEDLYLLDV
jgi:hypothetical protein